MILAPRRFIGEDALGHEGVERLAFHVDLFLQLAQIHPEGLLDLLVRDGHAVHFGYGFTLRLRVSRGPLGGRRLRDQPQTSGGRRRIREVRLLLWELTALLSSLVKLKVTHRDRASALLPTKMADKSALAAAPDPLPQRQLQGSPKDLPAPQFCQFLSICLTRWFVPLLTYECYQVDSYKLPAETPTRCQSRQTDLRRPGFAYARTDHLCRISVCAGSAMDG